MYTKLMVHGKCRNGFAMPTILIASIVMLLVLLTAISSVVATRNALEGQRLRQLAREAAESGLVMARECLHQNDYTATWSDVKPLRPNTNCHGDEVAGAELYVLNTGTLRSSFTVPAAVDDGRGVQNIAATAVLEQLRTSTGETWRTHTSDRRAVVGGGLFQSDITLGYSSIGTCAGVFFFSYGTDGTARGVGANQCGQLGIGHTSHAIFPQRVVLPSGVRIARSPEGKPLIFATFLSGGQAGMIIGTDGNAYVSGYNSSGTLGIGSVNPSRVTSFTRFAMPASERAISGYTSGANSYVITESGNIYASGSRTDGRLGDGTTGGAVAVTPVRMALPAPNPVDPSTMPRAIYADGGHQFVVMADGGLYTWGHNGAGQGGVGHNSRIATPEKVPAFGDTTGVRVERIETTGGNVFAVTNSGVYSAGSNERGTLGRGFIGAGPGCGSGRCMSFEPVVLPPSAIPGSTIIDARTDSSHATFLTDRGEVFSSGRNDVGQLGCGVPGVTSGCPAGDDGMPDLIRFQLPAGVAARSIYNTSAYMSNPSSLDICGANSYAIGDDGRVYGAGCNLHGQLGNGCLLTGSCQRIQGTPVAMVGIGGTSVRAVNVVSGRGTTVVRAENGSIYTVGANQYGQLGDGTTNDNSIPTAHRFANSSQPVVMY